MQFDFYISKAIQPDEAGIAMITGKSLKYIPELLNANKFRPIYSHQPADRNPKAQQLRQIIDRMGAASSEVRPKWRPGGTSALKISQKSQIFRFSSFQFLSHFFTLLGPEASADDHQLR